MTRYTLRALATQWRGLVGDGGGASGRGLVNVRLGSHDWVPPDRRRAAGVTRPTFSVPVASSIRRW